MAPHAPNIMWFRRWNRETVTLPAIATLQRENIVMHVCTQRNPRRHFLRRALGEPHTTKTTARTGLPLKWYSSSDPESPFVHMRYDTNDGKFLHFSAKGNIIRAGKHTHADALLSVIRFFKWSNCNKGAWFTGIATPNSVISGSFITPLSEKVKTNAYVSHSDKFPGIAVNISTAYANLSRKTLLGNCCTAEIYRSGKFIVPGVKTPKDLVIACIVLNDLHKQYGLP